MKTFQILQNQKPNLIEPVNIDATYGYPLDDLKKITTPSEPKDFDLFWKSTYQENQKILPNTKTIETLKDFRNYQCKLIEYTTWDNHQTKCFWLKHKQNQNNRIVIVGHGYGGRDSYQYSLNDDSLDYFLPIARGFPPSSDPRYPDNAGDHVITGIHDKNTYIIRGCVTELWSTVNVAKDLYANELNFYYAGGSFGGGLGAIMLPWEPAFRAASLIVPTFGHHPLRLECPCRGSGESVRLLYQKDKSINETLPYYDAAIHASKINIPVICGPALFDPAVPPPGQFAVANALNDEANIWIYQTGHAASQLTIEEDKLFYSHTKKFFQSH